MKKTFLLMAAFGLLAFAVNAQIGIGTTAPNASSVLDLTSTTQGFLAPRMSTGQRTAITDAEDGLLVYDTDTHSFWYFKNGTWTNQGSGGNIWTQNGYRVVLTDSNCAVGIGTTNPEHRLEVVDGDEATFLLKTTGGNGSSTLTLQNTDDGGAESTIAFQTPTLGMGSIYGMHPAGHFRQGLGIYGTKNILLSTGNSTPVMTMIDSAGNVGIGTIAPATLLHLYKEDDYPVLRLEGGKSSPGLESGRLQFVYNEGGSGMGYSMRVVDGEFWINRLTSGTLAMQDFPAIRLDPEFICINLTGGSSEVTTSANLSVNGSVAAGVKTISTNYIFPEGSISNDYVILANAGSNTVTINLPAASNQKGRLLIIKKIDATANSVTIDGYLSQTIDGALTYSLSTQYKYVSLQSNGSDWFIIGNN